MIRITNNVYLGKAGPASNGGGSGGEYTEGAGIIISGGQISLDPYALNDVTQRISGSGYVVRTSNSPGEYMYFNGSGVTMGASGVWRTSVGANEAAIRCNAATGLYMSGNITSMTNSGRVHYSATTGILTLYGSSTSTAIRMDSVCTMRNRGDTGYSAIIHEGMSATSNSMGITRPDNYTMIVNGGIMSVNPPETLWTSGNSGSEITYSDLSGGSVLRTYSNGLLMQSGAEYTIADGGVVSFTNPVESSDKIAFEYYPAAGTRGVVLNSPNGGAKGLTRGAAVQDPEQELDPEPETEDPEQEQEEKEER